MSEGWSRRACMCVRTSLCCSGGRGSFCWVSLPPEEKNKTSTYTITLCTRRTQTKTANHKQRCLVTALFGRICLAQIHSSGSVLVSCLFTRPRQIPLTPGRRVHARPSPINDVISMPKFMSSLSHEIAIMSSCPACDCKHTQHFSPAGVGHCDYVIDAE